MWGRAFQEEESTMDMCDAAVFSGMRGSSAQSVGAWGWGSHSLQVLWAGDLGCFPKEG